MPQPDLTDEERAVVAYFKTARLISDASRDNWIYVLIGIVLVDCGFHFDALDVAIAGAVMMFLARAYDVRTSGKWLPVYRSVFEKYDAAIAAADALAAEKSPNSK